MDLYLVDPWGERRADLRNAMACALLANIHRDDKKNPKPFTIEGYMPFRFGFEEPEKEKPKGATISSGLLTQLFLVAKERN